MATIYINGVTFSLYNTKVGNVMSHSINNTFCNPSWSCYKICYARAMANRRASVRTSYDRNTDVLINDRNAFFDAIDKAMTMAEAISDGYRVHVDGECPDYDYVERLMALILKHKDLPVIFMTKRDDLINEWVEEHGWDALPNIKPRISTAIGKEHNNPYGLPTSNILPKGEEPNGKWMCPNQLLKKEGKEWHCSDCIKCGCGCASDNDVWFFQS